MHHPFALALLFSWITSFAMIWIALVFKSTPYFFAGVLLWLMLTTAATNWINRR